MPFAQSGGTTGEVRAEAAGLNDRDSNAQRCHFARQNFGKTFDTPFRGRIGPAPRRPDPSAHRGKLKEMTCLPFAKVRKRCLCHDDRPKRFVSICARKSDKGVSSTEERLPYPALLITTSSKPNASIAVFTAAAAAASSVTSRANSFTWSP